MVGLARLVDAAHRMHMYVRSIYPLFCVLTAVRVQVTFQSVLARALVSEDGETEEQAPGFKGAFMHGVARIAPDVEEHKGKRSCGRY